MDFTFLIGFLLAWFLVIWGIAMDGITMLMNFVDMPSIAITVGGVIATLIMAFPFSVIADVPKHFGILFRKNTFNPLEYISRITDLAQEARRKGLLALEDKANEYHDTFLKNSIMLIVDAIEPEKVRRILETEVEYMAERHNSVQAFYMKGAAFAPAFGMIGTLIGLINMLANLSDQAALASGMAVALVTTFYGSVLANMVFIPIASRLANIHDEETLCKLIIIEGITSLQAGENPRHVEEKLLTMLSEKTRAKAEGAKATAAPSSE